MPYANKEGRRARRKWRIDNEPGYAESQRENSRKFYREHKDSESDRKKVYYLENKDTILLKSKTYKDGPGKDIAAAWREANYEEIAEKSRIRYESDRQRFIDEAIRRESERIKVDLSFRLSKRLRSRIRNAGKGLTRGNSAVALLGCSMADFKSHIEAQFQAGMTWDNWTFHGWHLDHIRPLCTFDLSDPSHVSVACHYSNLQPLWKLDNLRKPKKCPVEPLGKNVEVST